MNSSPTPRHSNITYKIAIRSNITYKIAIRLFGPELWLQYKSFQNQVHEPGTARFFGGEDEWRAVRDRLQGIPKGGVPNSLVYGDFMKWLNSKRDHSLMRDLPAEGAAHNLRSTSSCDHTVHPGIRHFFDGHPSCPVCLSKLSVTALERVRKAIEPFDEVRKQTSASTLFMKWSLGELRKIQRYEKLHWTKLITEFERLSAIEAAWEAAQACNPDASSQYTAETWAAKKSATQALEVLWKIYLPEGVLETFVPGKPLSKSPSKVRNGPLSEESCPMPSSQFDPLDFESRLRSGFVHDVRDRVYLRASSYGSESASQTSSQTSSVPYSAPHAKKSVTWVPDLLDDPSRHKELFQRGSRRYSPGRYTCPSPEGWEDTSWRTDRDWFADRGFRDEEDEKQDDSDSSDDSDDSDDSDEEEKRHEIANAREGQDDADSVDKGKGRASDDPKAGGLQVISDVGDAVQAKDQSEERSTPTTGPSIGSDDVTNNSTLAAQTTSILLAQRSHLARGPRLARLRHERLLLTLPPCECKSCKARH